MEIPAGDIESYDDCTRLVRNFYRQAAMDDLLGPVFTAAHVDWTTHLPKVTDFWAWQLLGIRGYEGDPLHAHAPAHARTPFTVAHYHRWLDLFESTLDDLFRGPVTELARQRARKMARALQRLLDGESAEGDLPIAPRWAAAPTTPRDEVGSTRSHR